MKAKRSEIDRLKPFVFFMLTGILFWAIILIYPLDIMANAPKLYMYIRETPSGFDWYCLEDLPYEDTAEQTDLEIESLVHQLPDLILRGYVIEVESCNLDMLMDDPWGYSFVWRFTSHNTDSHPDHRHMTRGAAWVQYRSVDLSGD